MELVHAVCRVCHSDRIHHLNSSVKTNIILFFAANTKTVEQQNRSSVKKNSKDATNSGNGTTRQKAEEKWKVVGKDSSKHDCHAAFLSQTAVEPEISLQTKSRKKRNRRNRDRAASSATLDFRSTSCSAVRQDDDDGAKNIPVSETKSFHTAYKEKPSAAGAGVCKQLSHVNKPHHTTSCHSSAGDCIPKQLAKDSEKLPTSSVYSGNRVHF